jgi:transcriptional regulator with XRE-family HTH domain
MEVMLKKNKVKNKILESVSSRLRQIRHHIDCKQYVMGKMIGIGELTYAKNERGLHLPSSTSLILLHRRLGISIEWLLFGHGPMYWKDIREEKKTTRELESFNKELDEMISLMKRIPLLHHSIMIQFEKFKIDNKELIREHLAEEYPEEEEKGENIK